MASLEEIPSNYQAEVYPLLSMDDTELQQEMKRVFPVEQWVEYETLLTKKKMEALTPKEQNRLDVLRYEADVLTFRKAYAAVLLKRRGHTLPALEDLGHPE
jgi:hypothetical protein